MAPIRVAIVGLSTAAKTTWALEAHLPYLLSARGKAKYEIVALLNSSAESAKAARDHCGLGSSVKAYGDPAALAADLDVDLVVNITRVDVHFPTIKPSIDAGKSVYIEWPPTENLQRTLELLGDRPLENSVIGLQSRYAPVIYKLKEILSSGRIGKALSSDLHASSNLLPRDTYPEGLDYFGMRKIGGNPIKIAYSHMIDFVHEVLGDFETFESRMQIQRPDIKVIDAKGRYTRTLRSDVPDLVVAHGRLDSSKPYVAADATLAVRFRQGRAFKSEPNFV